MNIRIVVADERQANFFDAVTLTAPPTARGSVVNMAGGKRDSELETDRPGRRYGGTNGVNHSSAAAGHHHGVDGERSTAQHDLTLFAKEVAKRVDADRAKHAFDKLVLVAPPKMLGLLRQSLPSPSQSLLAGEVAKDLVRLGPDAILRVLPEDAFFE